MVCSKFTGRYIKFTCVDESTAYLCKPLLVHYGFEGLKPFHKVVKLQILYHLGYRQKNLLKTCHIIVLGIDG